MAWEILEVLERDRHYNLWAIVKCLECQKIFTRQVNALKRTDCCHTCASIKRTQQDRKFIEFKKRWNNAKQRCKNEKNKSYPSYGGRGLVIEENEAVIKEIYESIGMPDDKSMQLDRIDNNKGYIKNNVKWSTPKQNSNNTRKNKIIVYNGISYTLALFCETYGLTRGCVQKRLKLGWEIDKIARTVPA